MTGATVVVGAATVVVVTVVVVVVRTVVVGGEVVGGRTVVVGPGVVVGGTVVVDGDGDVVVVDDATGGRVVEVAADATWVVVGDTGETETMAGRVGPGVGATTTLEASARAPTGTVVGTLGGAPPDLGLDADDERTPSIDAATTAACVGDPPDVPDDGTDAVPSGTISLAGDAGADDGPDGDDEAGGVDDVARGEDGVGPVDGSAIDGEVVSSTTATPTPLMTGGAGTVVAPRSAVVVSRRRSPPPRVGSTITNDASRAAQTEKMTTRRDIGPR